MIFSIFLSLMLILIPQIVHSPEGGDFAAVRSELEDLLVQENLANLQQKEGDVIAVSLPRAAVRRPQKKESNKSLGIEITARAALVKDRETGVVLFEKNSRIKLPMASLTKLMTALVFLETEPDWNKRIQLIKADEKEGGIFYARAGEVVTVKDLFNMMLVGSINNAAMALVRSTNFSESEFVDKMNQKAQELKLKDTNFVDPTGLEAANVSTARDIAQLVLRALENDKIKEAVSQKTYIFKPWQSQKTYYVKSTNELLLSFLNEEPYKIIGGKTGYIEESRYNLALEVARDGHQVIVVVLGSETLDDRFQEAKGLAVWTFENYDW